MIELSKVGISQSRLSLIITLKYANYFIHTWKQRILSKLPVGVICLTMKDSRHYTSFNTSFIVIQSKVL